MSNVETYYEELEHTADWTARVWGEDVSALFEHAAMALFELQGADLAAEPSVEDQITCDGIDLETLLVAWLNELLFASEMAGALFTRFQVHIAQAEAGTDGDEPEWRLRSQVQGVPGRGHLAHVKAVTYYNLSVDQTAAGWEATVTFDT